MQKKMVENRLKAILQEWITRDFSAHTTLTKKTDFLQWCSEILINVSFSFGLGIVVV